MQASLDPRAGCRICGGAGQFFALKASELRDWFRHQLWLAADLGQGISREQALRQLGRLPAGAEPAEPPDCLRHVAVWIIALIPTDSRSLARIAADIQARFGLSPRPSELTLLMEMLDLWRDSQSEEISRDRSDY